MVWAASARSSKSTAETDFVARTPDFKALAHDIAMQVTATSPRYVQTSDVPEEDYAALEREFGDREIAVKAVVLLEQAFIKDGRTVGEVVNESIGKLGENIVVRRFSRFELGESIASPLCRSRIDTYTTTRRLL